MNTILWQYCGTLHVHRRTLCGFVLGEVHRLVIQFIIGYSWSLSAACCGSRNGFSYVMYFERRECKRFLRLQRLLNR